MNFDAVQDMNAIEGVIASLAAKTNRPQGYPFSKITIYSTQPEIADFMPEYEHLPARNLPFMRRLDFKKAGKVYGSKVQDMKNRLDEVPDEFLIIAERFNPVDELKQKTTGCRKYMVEVEHDDQENRWLAIQFKKTIKKFITEDLGLNITPSVFGDKYPEMNPPCIPRVGCKLFNCKEDLYQALEKYGYDEFAETPIRLVIPTRKELWGVNKEDYLEYEFGGIKFGIKY